MPIEILMPALSPTMTEGNLVQWNVKEGDQVQAGDVMAEIETDKATMEVEAVDEGVIGKILVPTGSENVQVNAVIALLLEDGEDAGSLEGYAASTEFAPAEPGPKTETDSSSSDADSAEEESDSPHAVTPAPENTVTAPSEVERVFATPLARRLAEEKGIALQSVRGSGPHGRIIKADVEVLKASGNPVAEVPATAQDRMRAGQSMVPQATDAAFEDRPVSSMRKVIAKRLLESKQTVPHFYLTVDVVLDELLQIRKRLNEGLKDEKVTVNDFVIRALALALRDVPDANASWLGDTIRYYRQADVSVAVAIEDGLITPIVKGADHKSILAISRDVKQLAQKARDGKLKPEEFQGGTISVSNLGMYGVKEFSAIINPPQACILAVGAGAPQPIIKDGAVVAATVMSCTLSVDHRVVDGKVGADLLAAFKQYMENPLMMMA